MLLWLQLSKYLNFRNEIFKEKPKFEFKGHLFEKLINETPVIAQTK